MQHLEKTFINTEVGPLNEEFEFFGGYRSR